LYNDFYVYILTDPRKMDAPFYVGKGRKNRWKKHLSENYRNTTNRRKWCRIAAIKKAELSVGVMFVAHNLSERIALDLETAIIMHHGRRGHDDNGILTNYTIDHPPHGMCGVSFSSERRRKIGEANKIALKGRKNGPRTAEFNAAQSIRLRAMKLTVSPERRQAQREKMLGRKHPPHSVKTLQLMSEVKKGSKNGMYGRTHSEEAKAAIVQYAVTSANLFLVLMKSIFFEQIAKGISTQTELIKALNAAGITTRQGARWNANSVCYVLRRMKTTMQDLVQEQRHEKKA
jgi:hypothetical protein